MSIEQAIEALRAETIAALSPLLSDDQSQVVFAAGNPRSPLMVVGEAPGPQEDREGLPFVGRSGQLLQQVLDRLGLTRDQLWISNTVKVWPNKRQGRSLKTRAPNAAEKRASRPFFEREIALLQPRAILCLGGTAAQALIGKEFKITQERGQWRPGPQAIPTMATYHPSYILRMQGMSPDGGKAMLEEFTDDLRRAATRATLLGGTVMSDNEQGNPFQGQQPSSDEYGFEPGADPLHKDKAQAEAAEYGIYGYAGESGQAFEGDPGEGHSAVPPRSRPDNPDIQPVEGGQA